MADDYDDGRMAPEEQLVADLAYASAAGLDGALANPALQGHHLLLVLRNPLVTPALLQRIGRSPVWMKAYRVRAALVQHPKTPRQTAMSLISSLRWGDLARVALLSRLPIALRTAAEKILLLRLPELALGEKVSLARIATPPVIRGLRGENSPLVVRALLENASLRFEEVLFMAERADAPPALLSVLADSTRFARRQELRLALASHPRTPHAVALRLVTALPPSALAILADSGDAPMLVRVAAERRLGQGRESAPTARP
jgi:hypothetical protein